LGGSSGAQNVQQQDAELIRVKWKENNRGRRGCQGGEETVLARDINHKEHNPQRTGASGTQRGKSLVLFFLRAPLWPLCLKVFPVISQAGTGRTQALAETILGSIKSN
jgi:hypothetical protein